MKYGLYSIKDEMVDFAAPIPLVSDEVAKRWFHLQLHNTPLMRDNPTDYSLWAVGEQDSSTGIITGYAVPTLMERGTKHVAEHEDKETV